MGYLFSADDNCAESNATGHTVSHMEPKLKVLWFNLMRVEIRELRPEVVTEDDDVLVHYRSRTNE